MNLIRLLPILCFSFLLSASAKEVPAPPIQVETLLKTTRSWDGATLPSYAEGQPEVTILRITIAPGTALPEHKHPFMKPGTALPRWWNNGTTDVITAPNPPRFWWSMRE